MSWERSCRVVRRSRWLVLLLLPPASLLLSGIWLPAKGRLWPSRAHLLHVVFLHHRMLTIGVAAGYGSLPKLPISELHLSLLHFPFALEQHVHFPLLALTLRQVSRVLVLDWSTRAFGVILLFSADEGLPLHRPTHIHCARGRDGGKGLRLAVRSWYGTCGHSSLLSRLLRRRMGKPSLRVCLRGAVPLKLGRSVGAVW